MANFTKTQPILADALFAELQGFLSANLPWLNNTFGKAERVQKIIEGKRYFEPVWYNGNGQYTSLIPSQTHFGSYAFFTINESQTEFDVWGQTDVTMPFSLIVWVDMRQADGNDEYNTEAVKEEILRVLNNTHPTAGRFTINRVYERAENVWSGYTIDETDNQFTIYPFASFRFAGEINVKTICQ